MVAASTGILSSAQLRHAEDWPPDAWIYDPTTARFLTETECVQLGHGIAKQRRHALIYRPAVEVVPGILFEGYNVLSAPPKIGKTIISAQLQHAVDMGTDWLGRPVRQGPVLSIAMEDTLASVTDRDRRLLGEGLTEYVSGGAGQVVVIDPGDSPAARLARLEQLLQAGYHGVPYALVVIDTGPRFAGTGDAAQNAYDRGLQLTAPLDRLGLRYHVAILGIHHDRKGDEGDDFDAVSGGLSITGTAQCVMSLRRTRGSDTGVLSVYPRTAEEHSFALRFTDGAWALTPELAVELARERAGCRRDIVEHLCAHPQGATLQQLVQQLRQHSYYNIQQALNRLRGDGRVRIDQSTWSAVREPTAVTAPADPPAAGPADPPPAEPAEDQVLDDQVVEHVPPAPTATSDNTPPPPVPTTTGCSRCHATPARLHPVSAIPYCRTCCPSLWTSTDPEPAPADYQRPDWAPTPLQHPLTTFNRLIEQAFATKRVQLVCHPYPPGEVPEPLRKRGRGHASDVHEGRHHWNTPQQLPPDTPITVIDRNGSYLGTLGATEIPIGRLQPVPGRGPVNECGIHQLDHWPTWTSDVLPHPGGTTPRSTGPVWVSTETLKLMTEWTKQGRKRDNRDQYGTLAEFVVLRSLTGRKTKMEQLQAILRTARMDAIRAGDTEFEQFVKAIYSMGISSMGESGANTFIWRPEWPILIRSAFHANMHRAAFRAVKFGLTVTSVCTIDELHIAGDPFQSLTIDGTEQRCFQEGRELREWKLKGERYMWRDVNGKRETRR